VKKAIVCLCKSWSKTVLGTNQYLAIRVKFLAQGNNGAFKHLKRESITYSWKFFIM